MIISIEQILTMLKILLGFINAILAGTAIIIGYEANKRVKHGIPTIEKHDHLSGSLVGRTIKTLIPWDEVSKNIRSRSLKRKHNLLD